MVDVEVPDKGGNMKKFIVLTSALAAAACGGGGGSNVVGGPSTVYVAPRPAVEAAVATSNAQITSMPSEVVVASNSSTPVSVVGAETITSGGVTYTSYRLDDVKLFMAENLDNPGHSYVSLELNETTGEIDAVKMVVGDADSGRNERDGSIFHGPVFEYVPDGDDRAIFRVVDNGQDNVALAALETAKGLTGGHWNRVDEQMAFQSYGASAGLQYADFGHFNPVYRSKNENLDLANNNDIEQARAGTRTTGENKYRTDEQFNEELAKEDYQLFAGGYAIEGTTMVDTLTPVNGTAYEGKAIGRVYATIQNNNNADRTPYFAYWNVEGDGHDMVKAYTTSHARMTIGSDGSQELFMPFNTQSDTADTFYDVTITKATPNADPSFAFAGNPSNLQYRRNEAEANIEKDFTPGYYGVNTPVEAAGTARYASEQTLGTDVWREWEFQGAYGMTKQEE